VEPWTVTCSESLEVQFHTFHGSNMGATWMQQIATYCNVLTKNTDCPQLGSRTRAICPLWLLCPLLEKLVATHCSPRDSSARGERRPSNYAPRMCRMVRSVTWHSRHRRSQQADSAARKRKGWIGAEVHPPTLQRPRWDNENTRNNMKQHETTWNSQAPS
jgi:hypothetical protein